MRCFPVHVIDLYTRTGNSGFFRSNPTNFTWNTPKENGNQLTNDSVKWRNKKFWNAEFGIKSFIVYLSGRKIAHNLYISHIFSL